MSDIIERAEAWLDSWKAFGDWPVVSDLVAELKSARAALDRATDLLAEQAGQINAARAENQRLRADAEMWRGTQSMYRAMDKR